MNGFETALTEFHNELDAAGAEELEAHMDETDFPEMTGWELAALEDEMDGRFVMECSALGL